MKPLHESEDILPGNDCSPKEFDRRISRERLLKAIGEGLADAEAGRFVSDDVLGKVLDDEFGKLEP